MRNRILKFAISFFAPSLFTFAALGDIHGSICARFEGASVVFVGKLMSASRAISESGKFRYPCEFEVLESFKGIDSRFVSVIFDSESSVPAVDTAVLIFASQSNSQIYVGRYSSCRLASSAAAEIRYLRSFAKSSTARLSGVVIPDVGRVEPSQKGLNAKLVWPDERVTDLPLREDGVYDLSGLTAGTYKVLAFHGDDQVEEKSATVELTEGSCKIVNLVLPAQGAISGKLTSQKKPVRSRTVYAEPVKEFTLVKDCTAKRPNIDGMELFSAFERLCSDPNKRSAYSNYEGSYKVQSLLPGSYLVSVNILSEGKLKRFYYPGTFDKSLAAEIEIQADEVKADFTHFEEPKTVTVSGLLSLGEDSKRFGCVLVFSLLDDDGREIRGSEFEFETEVDKYGEFTISLPANFRYYIHLFPRQQMLRKRRNSSSSGIQVLDVSNTDLRNIKLVEATGGTVIVQEK